MKKILKIIKWFFIILLGCITTLSVFIIEIAIFLIFMLIYRDYERQIDSAKLIVGVYMLDLERTDLGIYSDSIDMYRDLTIEFKRNKTFKLNKSVPFIADTMGTWSPRGTQRCACIYYNNKPNKNNYAIAGNHFSFIKEGSPILYINSVSPRADQFRKSDVHTVYFKKIENE